MRQDASRDPSGFWAADAVVCRLIKYPSCLGPILMLIIALAAAANVAISKATGSSIPSVNDWIRHLMIPTVWLSLGNVAVNRGMISVDFLSSRFPNAVNRGIQAAAYLLGAAVTIFIGVQQWDLMCSNFRSGKLSSTSALNFHIWPFNLLIVLGMAITTLAFLWCALRQFVPKKTDGEGQSHVN